MGGFTRNFVVRRGRVSLEVKVIVCQVMPDARAVFYHLFFTRANIAHTEGYIPWMDLVLESGRTGIPMFITLNSAD